MKENVVIRSSIKDSIKLSLLMGASVFIICGALASIFSWQSLSFLKCIPFVIGIILVIIFLDFMVKKIIIDDTKFMYINLLGIKRTVKFDIIEKVDITTDVIFYSNNKKLFVLDGNVFRFEELSTALKARGIRVVYNGVEVCEEEIVSIELDQIEVDNIRDGVFLELNEEIEKRKASFLELDMEIETGMLEIVGDSENSSYLFILMPRLSGSYLLPEKQWMGRFYIRDLTNIREKSAVYLEKSCGKYELVDNISELIQCTIEAVIVDIKKNYKNRKKLMTNNQPKYVLWKGNDEENNSKYKPIADVSKSDLLKYSSDVDLGGVALFWQVAAINGVSNKIFLFDIDIVSLTIVTGISVMASIAVLISCKKLIEKNINKAYKILKYASNYLFAFPLGFFICNLLLNNSHKINMLIGALISIAICVVVRVVLKKYFVRKLRLQDELEV